jgi:hypothetical protein
MNLTFVAEVWDSMASYIDTNDRLAAATTLVDLLVDNNYNPSEIRAAFVGEKEVLRALEAYDDSFGFEDDTYDDDIYDDDERDDDW